MPETHTPVGSSVSQYVEIDNMPPRRHAPYGRFQYGIAVFLCDRLARLRDEASWMTQRALATKLGMGRHGIDCWETQKLDRQRPVPFYWVTRLCDALGVNEHELLHGTGQEVRYQIWARANLSVLKVPIRTRGYWCEHEPRDPGAESDPAAEEAALELIRRVWPFEWRIIDQGVLVGFVRHGEFRPYVHVPSSRVSSSKVMTFDEPSPVPGRPGSTVSNRPHATVEGSWRFGSLLDPDQMSMAA
jgi:hypothetical protein